MNFSFNYYRNLESVELYLCNPDGRELCSLHASDRKLTLRFNDLSKLEFSVALGLTKSDGTQIDRSEYYDLIETSRLVYATNVGWFKIVSVSENDSFTEKTKSVTAESLQTVFKNKGFTSEERVYCFYNADDPTDESYDSSQTGAMPSVVGQLYQQLGIKIAENALGDAASDSDEFFDDWTITYIPKCKTLTYRSFTEDTVFGYDWMVNDVENAFEVVFVFDFLHKAIQIKPVEEITQKSNLCLSFHNFMNSVQVEENAEDIVTVLNCKGDGVDISDVNPTGTNYIVDFSYFMNEKWMSGGLIDALTKWSAAVDAARDDYAAKVKSLRDDYLQKTNYQNQYDKYHLIYTDLNNAQSHLFVSVNDLNGGNGLSIKVDEHGEAYIENPKDAGTEYHKTLSVPIDVETVHIGETSVDDVSHFHETPFSSDTVVVGYSSQPTYNISTAEWEFNGDGAEVTCQDVLNSEDASKFEHYYFQDEDKTTYCKLIGEMEVDGSLTGGGFTRISGSGYVHSVSSDSDSSTIVVRSQIKKWLDVYVSLYAAASSVVQYMAECAQNKEAELRAINSELNIFAFESMTEDMVRELNCYWIEGEYSDEYVKAEEDASSEDRIDLAYELLEAGQTELSKVCQPHFSFSVDASGAIRQYEFRDQLNELVLGNIITVEKEEGLWYYPALLEMSFELDNGDDFSLQFANKLRLDDWGYTYADLIAEASSTSRQVSANWQNIMSYSKEKDEINALLANPLDATLRASMTSSNQEFQVTDQGILGRRILQKFDNGDIVFGNEQMKIVNNLIIFTDDGWNTAKTALGKIHYTEQDSVTGKEVNKTSYGLIAETIIGDLMLSKTTKIVNGGSSVIIDENGICIKNNGVDVFKATTDGDLTVTSYATSEDLRNAVSEFRIDKESIEASVSGKLDATNTDSGTFGWSLTTEGFSIYSGDKNKAVFRIDKDDFSINVNDGYIAGFEISRDGDKGSLCYGKSSFDDDTVDTGVYMGTDGISLGKNFSVGANGYITAKSGKIGLLNIKSDSLYYGGTDAWYDRTGGVYICNTGISFGKTKGYGTHSDGMGGYERIIHAACIYADDGRVEASNILAGNILVSGDYNIDNYDGTNRNRVEGGVRVECVKNIDITGYEKYDVKNFIALDAYGILLGGAAGVDASEGETYERLIDIDPSARGWSGWSSRVTISWKDGIRIGTDELNADRAQLLVGNWSVAGGGSLSIAIGASLVVDGTFKIGNIESVGGAPVNNNEINVTTLGGTLHFKNGILLGVN